MNQKDININISLSESEFKLYVPRKFCSKSLLESADYIHRKLFRHELGTPNNLNVAIDKQDAGQNVDVPTDPRKNKGNNHLARDSKLEKEEYYRNKLANVEAELSKAHKAGIEMGMNFFSL